eukprot:1821731-Prorocentrum_lima.AAC.1
MKCSTSNSEYHLRRWCPRTRGQGGKGGKDQGSSSGNPGVLYAQQVSGGLSEVPAVSGIMSVCFCGPDGCTMVPDMAQPQHPPPQHPP